MQESKMARDDRFAPLAGPLPRNAAFARRAAASLLFALLAAAVPGTALAQALRVFATTPDLGDLAREVGGDKVSIVTMVKGRDDPHFAEARPSFIKELSQADVLLVVGLELEVGYVPTLLQNARNAKVLPGATGFVDASRAIVPLDVPAVQVDRTMGDVHAAGSPHYLVDPVRGVQVARVLASKFGELRPADAAYFAARFEDLSKRVAVAMVGEALASKYDAYKLAQLADQGGLDAFLRAQGDREALGGWYARMLPVAGGKAVDDHWMWTYFARRFGLVVVDHLEPRPGIPPTTSHLKKVIERMKAEDIRVLIASPYYDPRHAAMVSEATGARILELAHQAQGREGAGTWIEMIDYNVDAAAKVFGEAR